MMRDVYWNIMYCLLQTTLYQYLLGVGIIPRWIGTVASRVEPQGFAETMPLRLTWVVAKFNPLLLKGD